MSFWTADRMKVLSKLWHDGLSASQVAARIGGCSRNAVISKLHRMGLTGRPQDINRHRQGGYARTSAVRKMRAANSNKPSGASVSAFNPASTPIVPADPYISQYEEIDVPVRERKKLVDLEEDDCRWPIGDPRDSEFHFCNGKRVLGASYCEHHARVAYQPAKPAERRRSNVHVHREHAENKETVDA